MDISQLFTPLDNALLESRTIMLNGPVTSELAHKVNKQLFALERNDPNKPIYVYINSPGGEVTSGFSIFDTMRFIKPKIYTIVSGLAASMGSIIALAASRENRFSMPNGKFLIHQPLIHGGIYGPAADLEIHAKDIIRTKERIHRLYAEETGQPIEEVRDATERDRWMTAEEAKEFGLISKILRTRDDLPK